MIMPGSIVIDCMWGDVTSPERSPDENDVLSQDFPWERVRVRAQNCARLVREYDCEARKWNTTHSNETFGDMLRMGRFEMLQLRNMGQTTMRSIDAVFKEVGLLKKWLSR